MLTERFDPLKGKRLQVLDKEGKANSKLDPKLDGERLLKAYRAMCLTRLADEKAVRLQRQGRLGAYPPSKGQEASQVGPALALQEGDWLVWAFREMGALLLRGVPLWRLYTYWMGNEEGSILEGDVKATPSAVPVGSQVPHAAGIAYAIKHRQEGKVVLCYFGDGATSEGDFHEGLNFAGVFKLPVVFLCQNNQYAISVPRERQSAAPTLAQKAVAYGFPGIQVDGNDLLALYSAAREAVDRARKGEGPTLIESFTYRRGDHTTSDDATRYRQEQELRYWEERDPLDRARKYLVGRGLWDEVKEDALMEELGKEVEEAVAKAEGHPAPSLEDVFAHTFAQMPPSLSKQLQAHRRDAEGAKALSGRKEG